MEFIETEIKGIVLIVPRVYDDPRGYFFEAYHKKRFTEHGIDADFVQDNQSYSQKGTLRGLHYQYPVPQAKLICVLKGEILDVAVDLRVESPTFGQWESAVLSAENKHQFFVPIGFAHGFQVLSEDAEIMYKCSDYYSPQTDGGISWSDPELDIPWPINNPILSEKDQRQPLLSEYRKNPCF